MIGLNVICSVSVLVRPQKAAGSVALGRPTVGNAGVPRGRCAYAVGGGQSPQGVELDSRSSNYRVCGFSGGAWSQSSPRDNRTSRARDTGLGKRGRKLVRFAPRSEKVCSPSANTAAAGRISSHHVLTSELRPWAATAIKSARSGRRSAARSSPPDHLWIRSASSRGGGSPFSIRLRYPLEPASRPNSSQACASESFRRWRTWVRVMCLSVAERATLSRRLLAEPVSDGGR